MSAIPLRAGALDLLYEDGDLRRVRAGDTLLCLRLYAAVRDRNWDTPVGVRRDETIDVRSDSFRIRYACDYRQGEIDFAATVEIEGAADGTLTCVFDGVARTDFWRNRIGLCLLHPASCAGWNARVVRADGSEASAPLPEALDPSQPVEPCFDLGTLALDVPGGGRVVFTFDGDLFEMEDQRNWTDASFKVFSTPLRLPYPVFIPAGTRVRQSVCMTVEGLAGGGAGGGAAVRLTPDSPVRLPAIGFCAGPRPLTAPETAWLAALRPAHRRGDVAADGRKEARETAPDGRLLRRFVYHVKETFSGQPWPVAADDRPLEGDLVSGTDTDFIYLNRMPAPAPDTVDAVSFQINPVVHARDDLSVMETLTVQAALVRTARGKFAKPVVVSPVTLAPRFSPYVSVPDPPPIPPDPRLQTCFGAAWTLGSVGALADGGAVSATYFAECGDGGLMDDGRVFPVWFVFRALADTQGAARRLVATDPFAATGLRVGDRTLVANLTDAELDVVVEGLAGPQAVRVLDPSNADAACRNPESWWDAPATPAASADGGLTLRLAPYAFAVVDPA